MDIFMRHIPTQGVAGVGKITKFDYVYMCIFSHRRHDFTIIRRRYFHVDRTTQIRYFYELILQLGVISYTIYASFYYNFWFTKSCSFHRF